MANKDITPGDLINVSAGRLANAVSGAGSLSWIVPIHKLDNLDFEWSTTGTLTGTFSLQISSSYRQSQGVNSTPTVIQAGTWTDISTAPGTYPVAKVWGTQPAGSTSTGRICAACVPAGWAKLVWTAVSGAGNITAYFNAKGI